jgi:hypothetical protein
VSDLNVKEVEIGNLKKSIIVQNDGLNILRDQINDKYKTITQFQRVSSKLNEDINLLKNKLVGGKITNVGNTSVRIRLQKLLL